MAWDFPGSKEESRQLGYDFELDDEQKVNCSALYSQEYVSALLAELEAKDKRIAEVEGSHKKLRETLAAMHNTITGGGAYTSLAGILTAVKRAYLESSDASASTVTVEGDSE
ncbi:hypothetical protein C2M05_03965 [Serratia marcescens]|nr:hypothetical protein C2M05_03965 [Serratia marcescens]